MTTHCYMNGLCARLVVVRNVAVFLQTHTHTHVLKVNRLKSQPATCDRNSSANDTF